MAPQVLAYFASFVQQLGVAECLHDGRRLFFPRGCAEVNYPPATPSFTAALAGFLAAEGLKAHGFQQLLVPMATGRSVDEEALSLAVALAPSDSTRTATTLVAAITDLQVSVAAVSAQWLGPEMQACKTCTATWAACAATAQTKAKQVELVTPLLEKTAQAMEALVQGPDDPDNLEQQLGKLLHPFLVTFQHIFQRSEALLAGMAEKVDKR